MVKVYLNENDSFLGGLRQVNRTTPEGIRYIPLDLPKFKQKIKVKNTFLRNEVWVADASYNSADTTQSQKYNPWTIEVLTERNYQEPFSIDTPKAFTSFAKKKYPELIEYMMTVLPFEFFYYVKLIMPHRDVFAHIDNNYLHYQVPDNAGKQWHLQTQSFSEYMLKNEPSVFNIHINGFRNNFYIAEKFIRNRSRENRDWSHIEAEYCTLPDVTDTYALMYTDSPHGVTIEPRLTEPFMNDIINEVDEYRVSVFILGKLDEDRHKILIDNSIKKYDKYIKRTNLPPEVVE